MHNFVMTRRLGLGLVATCGVASGAAAQDVAGEFTGNVAATSEYVFRGISSSGGAAVQGGLDYAHPTDLYVGVWGSNTAPTVTDGTEVDLYGGWAPELDNGVGFNFGAIYYAFPEDDQQGGETPSYFEVYGGASAAGLTAYAYYAPNFFNVDDLTNTDDSDGTYLSLAYSFPIKDDLSFGIQGGYQFGDGVEALFGDDYFDYGASINKDLGSGFAASFGVYATTLDDGDGGFADEDKPKYVVTLSKGFDL